MAVVLVSGHSADPVRQDYDYRASSTDAFDRCIHSVVTREAHKLHNVSLMHTLPPASASVRGGWKKLHAIAHAARGGASSGLLVWHDADAVPSPEGHIAARAMRIAREQPSSALWLQPSPQLLRAAPSAGWRTFSGVPLSQVVHKLTNSNSLQTGVLLVRASYVEALITSALRFYDADAETRGKLLAHLASLGVPAGMRGSQEQGPLTYHLIKSHRDRVQLVTWLQCEVSLGCNEQMLRPSFFHYSGCSFSTKRARKCLARYCDANASVDASWRRHSTEKDKRQPGVQRCKNQPGCCQRHPRACLRQ